MPWLADCQVLRFAGATVSTARCSQHPLLMDRRVMAGQELLPPFGTVCVTTQLNSKERTYMGPRFVCLDISTLNPCRSTQKCQEPLKESGGSWGGHNKCPSSLPPCPPWPLPSPACMQSQLVWSSVVGGPAVNQGVHGWHELCALHSQHVGVQYSPKKLIHQLPVSCPSA